VGIFTSSGEHQLDFTDDQGKLHATMRGLLPRSVVVQRGRVCPEISGYQAFLIIHRREPYALEIAREEAKSCDTATQLQLGIPPEALERIVDSVVHSEALRALNEFQTQTSYALRALNNLVRGMSALPGERSVVLLSPGFLTLTAEQDVSELVERALRARVLVNTLDAKGLAAFIPLGDATQEPVLPARSALLVGKKAQFSLDRFSMSTDVLRVLAHDTGGLFFGNSNDLDEGFRRLGTRPTVYYLLAFSPQNLKFDGKLHTLKVSLNTREKYTIQARSGYFAPSQPADAAVQSKEEIEQAVFSRDEVKELPVAVNTQFFKLSDTQAKLSVLTHLDLKLLLFRKENGRNLNNLTFVTALFDRDGKYLAGKEKRVEFRLLDISLEKLSQSGITARMSFDIPPGTYLIRQVVRDSEGAQLSALNRTVEIPF
jgi:VWFA-related protein